MKTELDLLRPLFPSYDVATVTVRTDCRRVMNLALNEMIHSGLFANSFTALANQMMPVMRGTCQVLTALNTEPEVEDFIHAAAEMASFVRRTMDEALKLDNVEDVRLAAVMTEIMIKGISTALGLPYDAMLKASAEGTVEFTEILANSGHVKSADVQLAPHQERLLAEKAELDKKAHALSQFIGHSPVFEILAQDEQERLREQNDVMWQYSEILGKRIAAFTIDKGHS